MEETTKEKSVKLVKSSLPLIYLVVALLALRWTVVEPYVVPTSSMEPTLKTGDRLYALKCAYDIRFPFTNWILLRTGTVHRGDVILFQAPPDPSVTYVKRAVGIPGDHIKYTDGVLYVNGQAQPRETLDNSPVMYDISGADHKTLYVETLTGLKHYMILDRKVDSNPEDQYMRHRTTDEVVVPSGEVFASGDNRDNSFDSRAWGFVPMENLKGRAMFIWFSSWEWRLRPERVGTLIQ